MEAIDMCRDSQENRPNRPDDAYPDRFITFLFAVLIIGVIVARLCLTIDLHKRDEIKSVPAGEKTAEPMFLAPYEPNTD